MPHIDDCKLLGLPQVPRPAGNLTALEGGLAPLGFEPSRTFFLYDIPGGAARGGHAHHGCEQMIVCVMGSFRVTIDDGVYRRVVSLDRAYYGLYVPPLIWTELHDFSAGAICLVLASKPYVERDYIRSYDDFLGRGRLTAAQH
jgi:hypothetical protein